MMPQPISLAVLISGKGSNLQVIIDCCARGDIAAVIRCVISNQAEAYGLERARRAGIPTHVLSADGFSERRQFDSALADLLGEYTVDLIVLAGFMRILGADLVSRFENRIINLHPSLLPKYKGMNTHTRVLANGDKIHGASVHFVTPDLDAGPIIAQERIPVEPGDTADSLERKVHDIEHIILPRAIGWFADNRLSIVDGRVLLDGNPSVVPGPEIKC